MRAKRAYRSEDLAEQGNSTPRPRYQQPAQSEPALVSRLLDLQRTAGNAAVSRYLARPSAPRLQRIEEDQPEQDEPEPEQPEQGQPEQGQPEQEEPEQEEPEQEEPEPSGEGDQLSVRDDFEPQEFDSAPDEQLVRPLTAEGEEPAEPASEEGALPAAPGVGFVDQGRTGTARFGDRPTDFLKPHAFTDGGRTGTVIWAGGGGAGAHGNENAGSVQNNNVPTYDSKSLGVLSDSNAWVRDGTGQLDVTRSWVGINAGNQGNGHFVTAGASTRINTHETLHVANSRGHYSAEIDPLLAVVRSYIPAPPGGGKVTTAYSQSGAISALKGTIKWAEHVTKFQNDDRSDNQPMGTVDTNDLASGTYPVDAGPGTVGGTPYLHRVRLPTEANPA